MNIDLKIIIILGLSPGIFWMWYISQRNKVTAESNWLLIKTFFEGILTVVPAALIMTYVSQSGFWETVVIIPIIEEGVKFLMVWLTAYQSKKFIGPREGIIYGCAVALGFASAENAFYLWGVYQSQSESVLKIFMIRAFLAVPGHALWASIWGYGLGFAKKYQTENPRKSALLMSEGLILAILMHGFFNFLLSYSILSAIGLVVLLPLMWFMFNQYIKRALIGENDSDH